MGTIAVLPIKRLSNAKQRLAETLDPPLRRSLVEAMFADALVALRRCGSLQGVVVVTADHNAQRIAAGYDAEVLAGADAGHSDAARRGVDHAVTRGADRVLLVPGDCPLLDPAEVDDLLAPPTPRDDADVLVVPDRHGTGTNALVLRPPAAIGPSFGPDSHARHLELAAAAGVSARTVEVGSLALDVDTAEDLAAVQERMEHVHGGAAHTRGMLLQLERSGRSA